MLKNKKSMDMMMQVIIWAVVAIIVAALVLSIIRSNLLTQQKNLAMLSNCKTAGGSCYAKCPSDDYTSFPEYGCPDSSDKSQSICCIPKNNLGRQIT